MGKGIKMSAAVDQHGKPYTVGMLEVMHDKKQSLPTLSCEDPKCGCSVRFVRRYQQNRKARADPVEVPAYIGLTSTSEHEDDCRYNAKVRMTVIAAQSDKDFLGEFESGKRELRLLLLHNGLGGPDLSKSNARGNGGEVPSNAGVSKKKTTVEFAQSDKKLDSYLSTTADIVALRAICESDDVLAAELTLRLGKKRILWKDFFFEQDRYDEAWSILKSGKTYPMALVGRVRAHNPATPPQKNGYLNLQSCYRNTDKEDERDVFEVSLGYADDKWLAKFPIGSEIVMFGIWKHGDVKTGQGKDRRDSKRTVTYNNHRLTLYPKARRQVVPVSP